MSRKPKAEPRLEPPADTGPGVCAEAMLCLALLEPNLLLHSCLVRRGRGASAGEDPSAVRLAPRGPPPAALRDES